MDGDLMPVTVVTLNTSLVRGTTAKFNGNLTDMNGQAAIDCYFQYKITGAGSWSDTSANKEELTAVGEFSHEISGLTENESYEVRAVSEWTDGTLQNAYGDTETFNAFWVREGSQEDFERGILDGAEVVDGVLAVAGILVDEFEYTGAIETINLAPGVYKFELWGAQGRNRGSTYGGLGGYAEGNIKLSADTDIYISVGQMGLYEASRSFGGGGAAHTGINFGTGGGGASDIRIGGDTLYDRVLVAGGGGGCTPGYSGGGGGGLSGVTGSGTGGSQTEGGIQLGEFGLGGNGTSTARAAGGGGWFGGGRGQSTNGAGGGGSSYIGGTVTIDTHEFPKTAVGMGFTESAVNNGHGKIKIYQIDSVNRQKPYKITNTESEITWTATTPTDTTLAIEAQVQGTTAITDEAVGTGDGTTTIFELAHWPADTPIVKVNGTATTDFTIGAGKDIMFDTAPADTHAILASYTAVDDPQEDDPEIQTLDLDNPSGGTFKLGDGTTWTSDIAYDASAADIETALEGLYGAGNVEVKARAVLETLTSGSGNWAVPAGVSKVNAFLVGGGGGGSGSIGGGGGAAGLLDEENFSVTPESNVAYVVGAGGSGGPVDTAGSDGSNTTFGTLTALGGGAGARAGGNDGGSGGGAGLRNQSGGSATDTDPPNAVYQGHDGGDSAAGAVAVNNTAGGGGGGAGEAGANAVSSSNTAGDGGDGLDYSDKFGTSVGDNGWFAGGGGGGSRADGSNTVAGSGGMGGGGDGSVGDAGQNAIANTGGGGGAGGHDGGGKVGGDGGSGIIIIYLPKFTITFALSVGNSGLVADFTGLT